jgi:hypothetical protein
MTDARELRAALDRRLLDRLAQAEAERDKAIAARDKAIAERDQALATLKEAQVINTQRKNRIRATKASQKARGEYRGGVAPFGWVYDAEKKLVEVPEQQEALRRIRKLADQGLTPYKICADLAQRGVRLSHMTVRKIVARDDA